MTSCSTSAVVPTGATGCIGEDAGKWLRVASAMLWFTVAYNVVEAVLVIGAGVMAQSVAMIGFGSDSIIEVTAALLLLWRLRLEAHGAGGAVVERVEENVHRFVGWTFYLLAAYVCVEASWTLYAREAPDSSSFGIMIAVASLLIMPPVAYMKLRAARELGSGALRAEARETLACSFLSATLLVGLLANAAAGWWWADPAAALAMVPWLVKEGREAHNGGCCADD